MQEKGAGPAGLEKGLPVRHPSPGLWVFLLLCVPGAASAFPRWSPVPVWVVLVRVVESAPERPEESQGARGIRIARTGTSHAIHLRWVMIGGRLRWRAEPCPHRGEQSAPAAPRAEARASEPDPGWVQVAPRAIGSGSLRPVSTRTAAPGTGAAEIAGETAESMLGRQLAEVLNRVQPERPYLPGGEDESVTSAPEPGFWPWFQGEILEPSWVVLRSLLALAITFKIADRIWDEF